MNVDDALSHTTGSRYKGFVDSPDQTLSEVDCFEKALEFHIRTYRLKRRNESYTKCSIAKIKPLVKSSFWHSH